MVIPSGGYGGNPRLKNDKALADMRHARKRARERYGVFLSEAEYWALVDQCLAGNSGPARFLGRKSKTMTSFSVLHGGRRLVAIYSSSTHAIRTFLPPWSKRRG